MLLKSTGIGAFLIFDCSVVHIYMYVICIRVAPMQLVYLRVL